ncbi:MAG: hypothetical protein U0531_16200 [Dehalococcoidia bacterium]
MTGDIPSTATEPQAGCATPALVLLIAAVVMAVAFVGSTCLRGGRGATYTTEMARLAVDDPVYVSGHRLYLVRQPSGAVLALSDREVQPQDDRDGCIIRFRETFEAPGRRGLFRGDCSGALYGRDGAALSPEGPSMTRHPVTVDGMKVTVDSSACLRGELPEPCASE